MSERRRPPLRLSLKPCPLITLSLILLISEVVFVHRDTQHYLCAILVDYKLIQMLFQYFWGDVTLPHITCATQRTTCRLISLVEGGEALPAEVGAIIRRLAGAVK
jgi:hypothetical protein